MDGNSCTVGENEVRTVSVKSMRGDSATIETSHTEKRVSLEHGKLNKLMKHEGKEALLLEAAGTHDEVY